MTKVERRCIRFGDWLWLVVPIVLALFAIADRSLASPLPPLSSFDITLSGLTATVDPQEPTIPKNTASAVRILVRAGTRTLTTSELRSFLGGPFQVHAELGGPGLDRVVTLPLLGPSDPPPEDPLLLAIPPLTVAGDYQLTNIRIERDGKPVLDVEPSSIPVQIIDQILITSVKTRPLTLDEIQEKGIVLDSDDYVGFEFTIGMVTDGQSVNFSMPVVFDRQGVAVPEVIQPPPSPGRTGVSTTTSEPPPLIVPKLMDLDPLEELEFEGEDPLVLPSGEPVRIPAVLVIPGNVGYLKQFFSAQLFVANGAPMGSGLTVHDVEGTVHLPAGADLVLGTADDPLALPETVSGPQQETMPVRAVGPDGEPATADDVGILAPAEQGQAEFLIRGEKEGFHELSFDIKATLEGLPVGPVTVRGQAKGGVLVQNPYFDMTFTVPSVVREGEQFPVYVTVSNIGQGMANDVHVTLDASRMSNLTLVSDGTQTIETLETGDAQTLKFDFRSNRTGQVVATYLNLDTSAPGGGTLKFTLGVGERGVALSPDTLTLPAAVDALPSSVVQAAMRVLGQAWSICNAPTGTLPLGVTRVSRTVATQKALALAEAGLRVSLGQDAASAVRDLAFDFYGDPPLDPGFDQLLRQTEAGYALAQAIGAELGAEVADAGGALAYEAETAELAVSGPDFISFALSQTGSGAPVSVTLSDASGRKTEAAGDTEALPVREIPGALWIPFGVNANAPLLGLVTAPSSTVYRLELVGRGEGEVDLSVTLPRGAGQFVRGETHGLALGEGGRAVLVVDLRQPDTLGIDVDADGDGLFESTVLMQTEVLVPTGPELISATVVGPETIDGASPFGFHVAALFDRVVDAASVAEPARYAIPNNSVQSAKNQLSGRFVFISLNQPEGPYIPTMFSVSGIRDTRGAVGPASTVSLGSRLEDPGAVISGRVIGPDEEPLTTGVVTYLNNPNWRCRTDDPSTGLNGFAAVNLDAQGRYEFRYVRRDACGFPWGIATQDPSTGALRQVTGFVQAAGEHIVVDIALFGQGTVSGTVRTLAGLPVPLANVTVVSQTDPQVGRTAVTDGDGHYTVYGITVGPVNVRAAKGDGVGQSTGTLARAGGSAQVDVLLDSSAASVAGRVWLEQGTESTPAAGVTVVYHASGTAVAVTTTDSDGNYLFESIPVGDFRISAAINSRDTAQTSGVVAAGDELTDINLVIRVPTSGGGGGTPSPGTGYATVRGFVRTASGDVAPGVIVSVGDRGVLSLSDGSYEVPGVTVQPNILQTVRAQSRDGLRSGSATFYANVDGQVIEGIMIALSGIGSAEFTVLSASGTPVVGQQVGLLDRCEGSCGCDPRTTDASGRVRYDGLPIGTAHARAVRSGTSFTDVVDGTASITRDGETATATMRFAGAGTVSGTVRNGQGQPVYGADVTLSSRTFRSESCNLTSMVSQRLRTNTDGTYRFQAVNVGPVSVTASQSFYPNPATRAGSLTNNGQQITLDIVLSEGVSTIAGELSGIVFMPDGATPAGAGIEVTATGALPDVVVTTDGTGRYRFAKVFPEGSYTLTARDPITGALTRASVSLRAGQDATRNLRLLGRGTVLVRVVDAADEPVQSAFVRLRETSFPGREFEGAASESNGGVVRFDHVFEGPVSAEVSDVYARGGRAASVLSGPGATLDLKVRLSMTGRVSGVFVEADGTTPVPFGAVTLTAGGRVLGRTTTEGSGPNAGRFGFDYVPAGQVRVDAQDPATARTGFAVGTIENQDQEVVLLVRAQGLGTVEGYVTSNGEPQAGADVDLVAGSFRAATMTDAAGLYRVVGVPEGPVVATADLGNGFLSGSASGTLIGDSTALTLNVPLHDSGVIAGHVVGADGISPAPPSLVTVSIGGSQGVTFSTVTDSEGAFGFERLPAGPAHLGVDVLGSIDQGSLDVQVPAADTVRPIVTLHGVGSIQGVALDFAGRPVAGTVVLTGTGALSYSRTLATAADGTFLVPELLAGPFTASLKVQTEGFALYGSTTGTVVAGEATDLTLRLQPTATVEGRALRADASTPALGTQVTLRLLPSRGTVVLYASSDGTFVARGVPLGSFGLSFKDPFAGGVAVLENLRLNDHGETLNVGDVLLDDTPVVPVAFEPPDGSVQVPVVQDLRVVFSDRLASAQGLVVTNAAGVQVSLQATLASDGLSVTLPGTWPDSQQITITATTAVTDIFGRHPPSEVSSRFTTVDLSPPRVASITPPSGAIEVAADAVIDVSFTEPLAEGLDVSALVALSESSGAIPGSTVRTGESSVRFTPAIVLVQDTRYTVTVVGARDASGNQQTTPFVSSFATSDSLPPELWLTSPAPGSWTNNPRPEIVVSLSDSLSGIDRENGLMSLDGVSVSPTRTDTSLRYTPATALADGSHTVEASTSDRAGNPATLTSSFQVDTHPPEVPVLSGLASGDVLVGTVSVTATSSDPGSGVAAVEVLVDGTLRAALGAPTLQGTLATANLSEGPHDVTCRARDAAGNRSAESAVVDVIVDNQPIEVAITTPPENQPLRDTADVAATVSEPVDRVVFSVGSVSVEDTAAPYAASLPLGSLPEGTATITATAVGLLGEHSDATRNIVVDRAPPAPVDVTRVFAEPPDNGRSFVYGTAGAVDPNEVAASVELGNAASGETLLTKTKADGSFNQLISAAIGDSISMVVIDAAGNRSEPATVTVRDQTTLPPTNVALTYLGTIVDRVGPGAAALAPDGSTDAVFSVDLPLGASITRQLSFVDLDGPTARSTRPEIGLVLGVSGPDLGAPLMNHADGSVDATLTGNTSVLVFAHNAGFIVQGQTYRATVACTNGARFVGTLVLTDLPKYEVTSLAFSANNTALPYEPGDTTGALLAKEAVSLTFSVKNQLLPFEPDDTTGALLAREAVSPTVSVKNEALPYEPGEDDQDLLATEAFSPTFSVKNETLPFEPEQLQPSETVSATVSVNNEVLPFEPEELLASEAFSPTVSVDNDPNYVPPEPDAGVPDEPDATVDGGIASTDAAGQGGAPAVAELEPDSGTDAQPSAASENTGSGAIALSVADVAASEADEAAVFTVSLSRASEEAVSVTFSTSPGTATPESEYEPVTGTVTLPAGTVEQTVQVPLHDDTLDEPDEVFALTLTNPVGAALARADAIATLSDNDPAPDAPAWLLDDYDDNALDTSRWLASGAAPSEIDGLVRLGVSTIESAQLFAPAERGMLARARVRFTGEGQAFGFNVTGDDTVGSIRMVFETGDSGLEDTARVRVEAFDETGSADLLDQAVDVPWSEFVDLGIEHGSTETVFLVNGSEVARVSYEAGEALSVGGTNINATATFDIDWIEVRPLVAEGVTCTAPPAGLLGWWPADGDALDLASNRTGTLEGGTSFSAGYVGQAFVLDGADDVVWVPESQDLALEDFTLGAWVLTSDVGSGEWLSTVVAKQATGAATTGEGGGAASYALQIDALGRLRLSLWDGTAETVVTSTEPLALGTWQHVAATRQGELVVLYADGIEIGSSIFDGPLAVSTEPGFDLELGSYLRQGPRQGLSGLLDEITIFDHALSASELQTMVQSGSAGMCRPSLSPTTNP